MIFQISSSVLRSFFWRLGRRVYMWARREAVNCFERNGECRLLQDILEDADRSRLSILLDIGANKGVWTNKAASLLGHLNISGHVHAFEPARSTFSYLVGQFKDVELVSLHQLAMSDRSGEAEFFVVGELEGTNSLLKHEGATVENVRTLSVDDFLCLERIEHVLLVKSDAEGHDMSVLLGAIEALRMGRIDVWQFEYNHRWIGARAYLKDVFDFISDKPYCLGKIYGNGVEIYEMWHPELERFFEANYVLIKKGSRLETRCSRVHFNHRNVLMPASPEVTQTLNITENQ